MSGLDLVLTVDGAPQDLSGKVTWRSFSWEEVLGAAGSAEAMVETYEPVVLGKMADAQISKGGFTLFRGRVLTAACDRVSTLLRIKLTLEDYNSAFDQTPVGAPDGSAVVTQDDDTVIAVDADALNFGYLGRTDDGGVFLHYISSYFGRNAPVFANTQTYVESLRPDATDPPIDRQTALTNLRSVLDEHAARTSGAVRYWVDPDLLPHWTTVLPSDLVQFDGSLDQQYILMFPTPSIAMAAPYELDADGITGLMPMSLALTWDWRQMRRRVYVRGSTIEGSGWVSADPALILQAAPEEYVDAPGSIYAEDKEAIGRWHLEQNYRELLTGTARISPGNDGWRVGQTVYVTDAVQSLITDHDVTHRPLFIQRVRGELKVPAQDQDDPDVGDVEYTIEFGDIPSGSLSRQLAALPLPEPPPVVYRFIVTIADPAMPPGETCDVSAQLADGGGKAVQIADVPMEWVVVAYDADGAPASGVSLADDVGTTDQGGRVFTTLTIDVGSLAKAIRVDALALPI